jgi:hypothetical protein
VALVRLDWTREEIILAMDLYVTVGAFAGGPIPGNSSVQIVQLSDLLKRLSAYPPEQQGEKYRNPDGVYLKLMNLRAIQTEGAHGMNAYSQLDEQYGAVRGGPAAPASRGRSYPRPAAGRRHQVGDNDGPDGGC